MNERIKELAEQATSHMPGQPPYDGLTFDVFDKEKFAKLIVLECSIICYKSFKNGDEVAELLMKNFGVEE
jgi:hypothetical protein